MSKEMLEMMGIKVLSLEARREGTALRIRRVADTVESLQRDLAVLQALQEEQESDLLFLSSCLREAMEEEE